MIRQLLSRARQDWRSLAMLRDISKNNPGIRLGSQVRILGGAPNITIGEGSEIEDGAILDFREGGSIALGRSVTVRSGAILAPYGGHIHIGDESGVNHYTILYGHGGLVIGSYVRFAAHCIVIPANHGFDRLDQPIYQQPLTKIGVRIGDDVWVGGHSTILDGVNIGDGVVIAAGSVVSRDIGSRTIAAGTPARSIRQR